MSPRSKKEYLEAIYLRYKYSSKREKGIILDEFCTNCGYHRRHATRLLKEYKGFSKHKSMKRGRLCIYDKPSIKESLKRIWLKANLPCSKVLKAVIPLWLPSSKRCH